MQGAKTDSGKQSFEQEKFLVLVVLKRGRNIEYVAATIILSHGSVIIDCRYKRQYWVSMIIGALNVTREFSFKYITFSRTLLVKQSLD